MIRPDVKEMDSAPPISALPRADGPRLPCPAHAEGYGEPIPTVVPDQLHAPPAPETHEGQEPEPYQADRAFHAMLARLTGGISPAALSLAYIDWASHLASAPQRQMAIAEDALQGARQFF